MNNKAHIYKNSFEAFLRNTNEKFVLRSEILRLIEERDIKSCLDIGSGNGDMALPISESVTRYVGVEKNPLFVTSLRAKKLQVHESTWPAPLPIHGHSVDSHFYDMVLLSHVVSYEKDEWKDLLREAWWHVRPGGGVMTLVTYRGDETDWTNIMQELGQGGYYSVDTHRKTFHEITSFLKGLGKVNDKKVVSHVTVLEHLDEMLQALEFVYTNGREDRLVEWQKIRNQFGKILSERYDANLPHSKRRILVPKYQFPFPHLCINVEKSTDVYISYKYRGEKPDVLREMISSAEGALHSQGKTTFCNLHADPYYHRNNFTVDQVMSHCFSELEGSKQHLVVIHSEAVSKGILQEIEISQKQGRKVMLAKKTGVEAGYLSDASFADPVIHWTNLEDLGAQIRKHPILSSSEAL
ncbi:MAG: hypothetical protein A2V81_04535 [Candidatus Abawacabacteria bacterium RBG_16_42_10]|uniref:Uncharacterized protein n=1 Tax=Candidatus Abawacabacteria bacterium RBG_16_42_10 TaxID=1817814 RepID=A0A1F4XJD6_9BACT|nr:MAG: hypothetical protein A2V81_04535 [Candidatus Abawacabacteria bacterium RBG_16_42_10]